MHKRDIDHLLETAVAKALGVKMPPQRRRPHRASRKAHEQLANVRHAA